MKESTLRTLMLTTLLVPNFVRHMQVIQGLQLAEERMQKQQMRMEEAQRFQRKMNRKKGRRFR